MLGKHVPNRVKSTAQAQVWFFSFCFVLLFVLFFNIAEAKVFIHQRQKASATARIR